MDEIKNNLTFKYVAMACLLLLSLSASAWMSTQAVSVAKSAIAADKSQSSSTIAMLGTGEADSKPDQADYNFTITRTASTSVDATALGGGILQSLKASLVPYDVSSDDVTQSGASSNPQYIYPTYNPGVPYSSTSTKISGYSFYGTYKVHVHGGAYAHLDEITAAITKNTPTGPVAPVKSTADPQSARDEARAKAALDAKTHAEKLAETLGVNLDRVVGYSEAPDSSSGYSSYSPYGQNPTHIVVRATVTYGISNKRDLNK